MIIDLSKKCGTLQLYLFSIRFSRLRNFKNWGTIFPCFFIHPSTYWNSIIEGWPQFWSNHLVIVKYSGQYTTEKTDCPRNASTFRLMWSSIYRRTSVINRPIFWVQTFTKWINVIQGTSIRVYHSSASVRMRKTMTTISPPTLKECHSLPNGAGVELTPHRKASTQNWSTGRRVHGQYTYDHIYVTRSITQNIE